MTTDCYHVTTGKCENVCTNLYNTCITKMKEIVNLLILNRPDEDFSRNTSCALK